MIQRHTKHRLPLLAAILIAIFVAVLLIRHLTR